MKNTLSFLFVALLVIGITISGCDGDSVTSPDTVTYTQNDLTGTWEETTSGRRYIFDSSGNVTDVISGTDQVFDFSGNVKVTDSEGHISGTIFITHKHSEQEDVHSHDIEYSGVFSSMTEIYVSWNIQNAGSGTTTWYKVE